VIRERQTLYSDRTVLTFSSLRKEAG
jgi:hypothetical protein